MGRKKKSQSQAEASKPLDESPKVLKAESKKAAMDKERELAQNDIKNHPKFSKFKK